MPAAGKATHKVEIHPSQEDYMDYIAYLRSRMNMFGRWYLPIFLLAIVVLWLFGDFLNAHKLIPAFLSSWIYLLLLLSFIVITSTMNRRWLRRAWTSPAFKDEYINSTQSIELMKSGFRVKAGHSHIDNDWQVVTEIIEDEAVIAFFIDLTLGYFVPRNSFDSEEAANEFAAAARDYHEAAKNASPEVE